MIRELFSDDEVQAILRIALSAMGITDRLLENSTQNGKYSVASGYKVARDSKKREREEMKELASRGWRMRRNCGRKYRSWISKRKSSIFNGKLVIIKFQ